MTPDVVGPVELLPATATRTQAWHAARRTGIGGSEIAAVIGISPYLSAFNLWWRKHGEISTVANPDNEAMEWGRRLETMIVTRWWEDHPELTPTDVGLTCRGERPWQMATADALVYEGRGRHSPVGVVEAKTTDSWDGWGEPGTDEIPLYYRAQTLWGMDVFGVDVGFVPVLSRGKDYREYVVHRNRAARGDLTFMRKAAKRFLRTVQLGQAPPLDESDSTREALWLLHPHVKNYDITVSDTIAETYRALREERDRVQVDLDGVTNELLDLIGDGKRAVDSEGKIVVTRSVFPRSSIDVKRLRLEHPRIAKRFEQTSVVQQVKAPPKRKGTS